MTSRQAPIAERGRVRAGDTVVVLDQGPGGLSAIAGAKQAGAARVIAVESDIIRAASAKAVGANIVLDPTVVDVVAEVRRLTGGVGAHVTIGA